MKWNTTSRELLPRAALTQFPGADPVSPAPTQLRANVKNGDVQSFYVESKSGSLRGSDGTRAIGAKHIDDIGDWTI